MCSAVNGLSLLHAPSPWDTKWDMEFLSSLYLILISFQILLLAHLLWTYFPRWQSTDLQRLAAGCDVCWVAVYILSAARNVSLHRIIFCRFPVEIYNRFALEAGLRQGCVLSALRFILLLDQVLKQATTQVESDSDTVCVCRWCLSGHGWKGLTHLER